MSEETTTEIAGTLRELADRIEGRPLAAAPEADPEDGDRGGYPPGPIVLNIRPPRRAVKVTLYVDEAIADRLEDFTLAMQHVYRRERRLEKGMVADAVVAAGLDNLAEAEAWLTRTYVR